MLIVHALAVIPAALFFVTREPYPDGSSSSRDFTVVVSLVTYILLAALLLIFAKRFGALLTRGLENTSLQVDESSVRTLEAVAFSVLGAYVLIYSLPALIKMIAIAVIPASSNSDGGAASRPRVPVADVVKELAQMALGVWLLFGGKRIFTSIRSLWKNWISPEGPE